MVRLLTEPANIAQTEEINYKAPKTFYAKWIVTLRIADPIVQSEF